MILICYYHIMLLLTYWWVICLQVPDVMDQHASSFKLPDQAFKPRILKTDAQSRLRNLRVYHPPRRKSRSCDNGDLHVRKIYIFVASLLEKHWFDTDDWSLQQDPTFWLFRFHFNFIPLCPFHFVDGFYCMFTSSVYVSCLSVKATCLSRHLCTLPVPGTYWPAWNFLHSPHNGISQDPDICIRPRLFLCITIKVLNKISLLCWRQ